MLNKKVNLRLCDFDKIQKNAIFEKFNWDDLIDFKLEPKLIPFIENLDFIMENTTSSLSVVMKNFSNIEGLKHEIDEDENQFDEENESFGDYNLRWDDEF